MDSLYSESRPILPKNLTYITAAVLVATLVFMVFSEFVLGTTMPSWSIPVTAVIFVVIIVLLLILKMDLKVYDDRVEISYAFRKVTVDRDEIIDTRVGDLTDIRNYANWNLKGVKHRAYSRIGDDEGIAMKLVGKRVIVVSASEPEAVYGLLPKEEKGE